MTAGFRVANRWKKIKRVHAEAEVRVDQLGSLLTGSFLDRDHIGQPLGNCRLLERGRVTKNKQECVFG